MEIEFRNALAVGTELDTYRIERVLGEGGFGVTYLVTELNLGKEYAIKELIPDGVAIRQGGTTVMARSRSMEGDFEATRRHFIKEARVLATLKHPAIVAVHRLFEANGTCYMVMDYVEGETLGAYLKKQGGKLSSREEFEGIFYPIMDGLEVLHGKEMIHRDIKPGNIMVSPDGSPVLLDFGASCRVENHTVTMTQMHSAGYSPFEQYTTRAKQGPYTDIYALGATMVRAITGTKPDDATDRMMGDTYSSMTDRAELVSVYGLELLSALDASVIVKIEDRPQSIRDWRKLMEAVVTPADVEVPESPKPEREKRVSQPLPQAPNPTIAPLSDIAWESLQLPESVSNGGFLDDFNKRIIVGVLVGVFLVVLTYIAFVSDSDKGNQTATATPESYRKAAVEREAAVTNIFDLLVSGEELDPNFIKEIDLGSLRFMGGEGDFRAQYSLGKIYFDGLGVAKNEEEAAKWFRKSAEQGCAEAQNQLGLMYDEGRGVEEDEEEAVKWYRLAADQGDVDAQYNLGLCYANGEGVEKDEEEAVKWYRLSADQGDAIAQFYLGVCYANGRGVTKDDEEAVKWYRLSADQGDAKAQHELGFLYYNGRGVTKDDKEAVKWYRLAADQGYVYAQYELGVMYDEGRRVIKDDEEAVKWYRKAAEQDYALAQYSLGLMYLDGRGVTKNDAEAVKWCRKAADQGEASAQYNLGWVYANGRGVTKDEKEAVKWYRLAADQGDAAAQSNLGIMYMNGRGVTKDDVEAVKWYRLAADQGFAIAQSNLGIMYATGRGVTKDRKEAAKWFRLAAEQGNASAQYYLGLSYYYGQGVAKDLGKARLLFTKAADQGDESAKKFLLELDTPPATNPTTTSDQTPSVETKTNSKKTYQTARKIPGRSGYVFNPWTMEPVDVRGIPSGSVVQDPNDPNKSIHRFRVP